MHFYPLGDSLTLDRDYKLDNSEDHRVFELLRKQLEGGTLEESTKSDIKMIRLRE